MHKPHPFRTALVLVLSVLVIAACGNDDDGGDAGGTSTDGEQQTETSSGEAWTDADLARLVETEIPGFTAGDGNVTEFGNASVVYTEATPSGPVSLEARVTLQACDPFTCPDLSGELTEEQRNNLRSLLPAVHLDNPDLVESFATTQLGGVDALAVYFRSFVDDGSGQSTTNGFRAFVHDEVNLIVVLVTPSFEQGLADSADELESWMDEARGAAIADQIVAGYAAELS